MKQQTRAIITEAEIDGTAISLSSETKIALEFSAIDTGGGFHDPILDFSYQLIIEDRTIDAQGQDHRIILHLQDPSDEENSLEISYRGKVQWTDDHRIKGMGRLKDDDMNKEIVMFVMRCVR